MSVLLITYGPYYKHTEVFYFDESISESSQFESELESESESESSDEDETTTRFDDEVDETTTQFIPPERFRRSRMTSL